MSKDQHNFQKNNNHSRVVAPIATPIEFDRFDTEQASDDEELLVTNTPRRRFYLKRDQPVSNGANSTIQRQFKHSAMVMSDQNDTFSIDSYSFSQQTSSAPAVTSFAAAVAAQNSLIIGELSPEFLTHATNFIDSQSTSKNVTSQGGGGDVGAGNERTVNFDYIDSTSLNPSSPTISLYSPNHHHHQIRSTTTTYSTTNPNNSIVPYLILPLSPTIKRIKIENNSKMLFKTTESSNQDTNHVNSLSETEQVGAKRAIHTNEIMIQEGKNNSIKKSGQSKKKRKPLEQVSSSSSNRKDEDKDDDEEEEEAQRRRQKERRFKAKRLSHNTDDPTSTKFTTTTPNSSLTEFRKSDAAIKQEPEPVVREQWDRKIEFLLAIIGFSVDLGNIWRFPKVVYDNGGGQFLIPYFVQLIFCGIPLFYMELVLGQFHQTGFLTLWDKICPLFKGIAFTAIIIDLFMAMFYNTIIAWAVYYLFLSLKTEVPWKKCGGDWNTFCCYSTDQVGQYQNFSLDNLNYQCNMNQSITYKVYDVKNNSINKRLVILNTHMNTLLKNDEKKNVSYNELIFDSINEFFNGTNVHLNHLAPESYYSYLPNSTTQGYNKKVQEWIRSYFVIVNNTITEIPPLSDSIKRQLASVFNDPVQVTSIIENEVSLKFANQSLNIILNCAENLKTPAQEYYTRYLTEMHKSSGIENLGTFKIEIIISLFFVFVTVYFALWKGIKSTGKAVWITAIAPYVVMLILLVRGLTLEGSSKGLEFYLKVEDWSKLLEGKIWIDAAAQIFFSLGPGFGTIIALSSYNKRNNNCFKDALLTSFINCFTSILSGFVVFSTLGHMAHKQGKSIKDVTDSGPGLIFVTYPQAISMMPVAPLWATIFFFMLFTLGIDSTFGGLESVITGICDTYPSLGGKRRPYLVLGLISICFVAALPTVTNGGPYIVHLLDSYAVAPAILIVVFFEVIGVMYIYGCDRFCYDVYTMINRKPSLFWILNWKFISPAIVFVMAIIFCKDMLSGPLTYGDDYVYEGFGQVLAALIVGVPISCMFLYVIYKVAITPGPFLLRFHTLIQPAEPWDRSLMVSGKLSLTSGNGERPNLLSAKDNVKDERFNMTNLSETKNVLVSYNNNHHHHHKEEPVNL